MPRVIKSKPDVGLSKGFRSGLEGAVATQLAAAGIAVDYEGHKVAYTIPSRNATYTPDFVLPNGIIVETKGRFVTEDRKKHLMIREQFPKYDIRFVFSNPNQKIGKTSKTTYAKWCETNGFIFAARLIPHSWFEEPKGDREFPPIKKKRATK